ncbi:MAG: hypothetical protein Q4A47_05065 [Erysipelotrichaceae bacterium]|nr:hypothetical protein [Erysipelotrichaceae bacterium]
MGKKETKLSKAQKETELAVQHVNQKIDELGVCTSVLYSSLKNVQVLFDSIRNVPNEDKIKYEKLKETRNEWKKQVENIEIEYKKAEIKAVGQGAVGVGVGVAVVALGPTAAMGVATTFGVASTGTAIAALHGVAATNAALAWLGGGALAAGGGGMAAGQAFLALAGPVGWTIAGLTLAFTGLMLFKTKEDKERLENIFTLISNRDTKSYELAIVELKERIDRIKIESKMLANSIIKIEKFGNDYNKMTEAQQYELGSYVNLMESSTMLLVNPILGLQPKYTEQDLEIFKNQVEDKLKGYLTDRKNLVLSLANLLYKVDLNSMDRNLLTKSFKQNKDFLESFHLSKKEFDVKDLKIVSEALNFHYPCNNY